ncbi:hypothetical protein TNIN_107291 [Trichonephila inaurata madagascariensis]|uniref:Uncharacterized protein n=1 Tax=Trichonephila inaurata madagascariensis TaxID=2747483 RepID=A0A8X6Y0M8_9ARAC|nr:hypothetical protein TNIN_107291 [Trichonephila inaurata madagascariensis]
MLRELYIKTADANLKKNKQPEIICNCNLQQFEIICYESIDILQAPTRQQSVCLRLHQQSLLWEGFFFRESRWNTSIKHLSHLHAFKTIEIKIKTVKPSRNSFKIVKHQKLQPKPLQDAPNEASSVIAIAKSFKLTLVDLKYINF